MIDSQELYKKAIEKWGKKSQVEMLIEECSEVIQAVQKLKREYFNNDLKKIYEVEHQLCGELADLTIMLEQMNLIFDKNHIEKIKQEKLLRLKNRIDGV